jgi:transcriptional regulator with XRE-family HTH domain
MPSGVLTAPPTRLGRRIRYLRETRDWKQGELAARVGTLAGRISDYETGRREPSLLSMRRIAHALDMSVSELLDGVM